MFSAAASVIDELSNSFEELAKSALSAGHAASASKTVEGMTNPKAVGYQIMEVDLNSLPIASQLDELKRLLTRKSNEYVFADMVKECITVNERQTNLTALNKVIEFAESSTAASPAEWNPDPTIACRIHGYATSWRGVIDEAASRLRKELEASHQAGDGLRALEALRQLRTFQQIVVFHSELSDLDNACFATSAMLVEGLTGRLVKGCEGAEVPRDLLGAIDHRWRLGTIPDAVKSEMRMLVDYLRQACQLSQVSGNAPPNQCSTLAVKQKAASDATERAQTLLRASQDASSYADSIRKRCAAAGLQKPEDWLAGDPTELPLSTILTMVESQQASAKRARRHAEEEVRRVKQETSKQCQDAEAAMRAKLEQTEKEKQQLQQQVQMSAGFFSGIRMGAGLAQGAPLPAQSPFPSSSAAGPSRSSGTLCSSFESNLRLPPPSTPQITLVEPWSSEPFDSRPLCQHYRQGYCRFGEHCASRHA